MAKKKRRNSFDLKHLRNLNKSVRDISDLYTEAQTELINIGLLSSYHGSDLKLYTFADYPELNKIVNARLKSLRADIVATIKEGQEEAWELANAKNDAMVKSLAAMTHIDASNFKGCLEHNLDALSAFQGRKINGLGLSGRVWNICQSFKSEMELALSVGIKDGASAAEMSKDVRHLLKYPDKLFRRVRDKNTGELKLSKAAKAFHPGRGVYRSSYKNALRLTATEGNMAYRTSDYERWQQLPFVTGIEIQTSNNHPDPDICDDLSGVYPKNFKFVGWHPHCRCFATPKMASVDDFEKYLMNMDAEEYTPKEGEVVKDVPNNFKEWLKSNGGRIASAKSLPYFLRDNKWAWGKAGGVSPWAESHRAAKAGSNLSKEGTPLRRVRTETEAKRLKIDYWVTHAMANFSNLTEIEKKAMAQNWLDIEKAVGIKKGSAMTPAQADLQKANPFYGRPGYNINCATCAPTYVLREHGFNIIAKRRINGAKTFEENPNNWVAYDDHCFQLFKNLDGTPAQVNFHYEYLAKKGYKQFSKKRLQEYLNEICSQQGTYLITVKWKGRGGHATILKRTGEGLFYIEPQVQKGEEALRPLNDLIKKIAPIQPTMEGILRVDDKLFDVSKISIFAKSAD